MSRFLTPAAGLGWTRIMITLRAGAVKPGKQQRDIRSGLPEELAATLGPEHARYRLFFLLQRRALNVTLVKI